MRDSDQEIVRQVLSSILDRLDGGARAGDQNMNNHNRDNDNSIVLVVMGQARAQAGDARDEERTSLVSTEPLNERAIAIDRREMQATHPGFERFPIADVTTCPAPKTCFMEPGRACVNSGACEMRGY